MTDNNLFRSAASTLQAKIARHRRRVRARRLAQHDLQKSARVRLSGPHRVRQSAPDRGIRPALLPIVARPTGAGRPCAGHRARNLRAGCAQGWRGDRRQVRHGLFRHDGRRRRAGIEGARCVAEGFRREEPAACCRPELHGGLLLPRTADGLPQHRPVLARARLGRLPVPVRRHHHVLDALGRRPRPALFLLRHLGQRAGPGARGLPQLRARRSAHQDGRAVHRRHPPARGVHARRRSRTRDG